MKFLFSIKRSFRAFLVAEVLNFLSLGALGALIYYACYPILAPFYGDLNSEWGGDWVWGAMVGAGMLWPAFFLLAGWLNLKLEARGMLRLKRRAIYVAVLWLGALLIWWWILLSESVSRG